MQPSVHMRLSYPAFSPLGLNDRYTADRLVSAWQLNSVTRRKRLEPNMPEIELVPIWHSFLNLQMQKAQKVQNLICMHYISKTLKTFVCLPSCLTHSLLTPITILVTHSSPTPITIFVYP